MEGKVVLWGDNCAAPTPHGMPVRRTFAASSTALRFLLTMASGALLSCLLLKPAAADTLFPYPFLGVESPGTMMAIDDLNEDGIGDIAVAGGGVSIFVGQGDGYFTMSTILY